MNIFEKINWHFVFLLLLIILCESSAQTLLEKANLITNQQDHKKNLFVISGIILYAIVGFIYHTLLNSKLSLAIVNALWQASTIIVMTLISIFYFKQKIHSHQIIGIVIVTIGCLFIIPE